MPSAVPTATNDAPLSLVVVAVTVAVFTLLVTGKEMYLFVICSYQINLWSLIYHCTMFLPPTVTVVTAVIICLKTTAKKGKNF